MLFIPNHVTFSCYVYLEKVFLEHDTSCVAPVPACVKCSARIKFRISIY